MSKRKITRPPDPKPYEYIKPDYSETTQAGIDRIIHYSLKVSRDSARDHNPVSFQGDVIKRRLDAICRYLPGVKDKYSVTKTSLGFMTNTELWAKMNLFPYMTYTDLDEDCHITLGAALWLLDRVTDPYEIGEILSADYEPTDLPHFYDVSHSTDTVQATVHAILNRKDAPQYSQLLKLVNEIDVEVAATRFKNTLWKWVDRLFEAEEYIARAYKEPVEKSIRAVDSYNASLDHILRDLNAIETRIGTKSKPKQPVNLALADPYGLKGASWASTPSSRSSFSPLHSFPDGEASFLDAFSQSKSDFDNMRRCESIIHEVNDRLTEIFESEMKFLIMAYYQGFISPRAFEGIVDVDFTPLPIENPYEMCFAFIYLHDQGDELTWLWGVCGGFLHHVYRHLPWGLMEFKNKTIPMPRKNVAIPETCRMQYESEEYSFPFSMGHIIYQMTGAILPRDMHFMDGLAPTVRKLGVKGKDVNLMIALMNVLNAVQGRTEVLATEEDEEETVVPTEDVEELKEHLKKLREQNKKLTDLAHEQDRRARKAEAALAAERDQIESDRRELAGLREVVFASNTSSSSTDDEHVSVALPHKIQSRLIIFGGHDMWQKPMKEYLTGDIRFIDRDMAAFDTDVIKYADEIWIQTNCISHKMYYKIMDAARKWKKQVKYFLYASARKCAEQLVLSEEES